MLHPSYSDLMKVVNSEVEEGETPVVNSRYSIVMATAKRARQINSYNLQLQQNMIQFVGPVVDVQPDEKPLAVSLREINEGLLSLEANPEA